jgi:hypothetical protein
VVTDVSVERNFRIGVTQNGNGGGGEPNSGNGKKWKKGKGQGKMTDRLCMLILSVALKRGALQNNEPKEAVW